MIPPCLTDVGRVQACPTSSQALFLTHAAPKVSSHTGNTNTLRPSRQIKRPVRLVRNRDTSAPGRLVRHRHPVATRICPFLEDAVARFVVKLPTVGGLREVEAAAGLRVCVDDLLAAVVTGAVDDDAELAAFVEWGGSVWVGDGGGDNEG